MNTLQGRDNGEIKAGNDAAGDKGKADGDCRRAASIVALRDGHQATVASPA
ncbi:MAG: hypothetical protein U0587_20740 [Candidatus Binatia bacterium]